MKGNRKKVRARRVPQVYSRAGTRATSSHAAREKEPHLFQCMPRALAYTHLLFSSVFPLCLPRGQSYNVIEPARQLAVDELGDSPIFIPLLSRPIPDPTTMRVHSHSAGLLIFPSPCPAARGIPSPQRRRASAVRPRPGGENRARSIEIDLKIVRSIGCSEFWRLESSAGLTVQLSQ